MSRKPRDPFGDERLRQAVQAAGEQASLTNGKAAVEEPETTEEREAPVEPPAPKRERPRGAAPEPVTIEDPFDQLVVSDDQMDLLGFQVAKPQPNEPVVTLSIRVPVSLRKVVRRACDETDMSLQQFTTIALQRACLEVARRKQSG